MWIFNYITQRGKPLKEKPVLHEILDFNYYLVLVFFYGHWNRALPKKALGFFFQLEQSYLTDITQTWVVLLYSIVIAIFNGNFNCYIQLHLVFSLVKCLLYISTLYWVIEYENVTPFLIVCLIGINKLLSLDRAL